MFREIGSEFELAAGGSACRELDWLPRRGDECLTFSGRTAIETVLLDLSRAKSVLLPSYCCDSMIEPFRQHGFHISFYDVNYDTEFRINMEIPQDCDVVLWCNYFGFHQSYPHEAFRDFQQRGGVVIEDITHSLLSAVQYHSQSDYLVASVRKWFPVYCGGFSSKQEGNFRQKPEGIPPEAFLAPRREAMERKRDYIDRGNVGDKPAFLSLYGQANSWLAHAYSGLKMDEGSAQLLRHLDIEAIRGRRRENADILYEGLRQVDGLTPLFPRDSMDCPIFLPVVADGSRRAAIRQKLTEAAIYCPCHWPHPAAQCDSNLYDRELSLICDQRYSQEDMYRIIEVLIAEQRR